MTVRQIRIGDVMVLQRRAVAIDLSAQYRQIGVRGFGRGMFRYDPVLGSELGKLRYFTLTPGALVVSNIKGWEGAVATSTDSDSDIGLVASNRFLTYVPTSASIDISYVKNFLLSDEGLRRLGRASPGSADRNRTLSVKNFENLLIPLPDLPEQRRIAERMERLEGTKAAVDATTSFRSRQLAATSEQLLVLDSPRYSSRELLRQDRQPIDLESAVEYPRIGVRSFGRGLFHYSPLPGEQLPKLRYFAVKPNCLVLSNIKAWEGAVAVSKQTDSSSVASNRFLFYSPVDPERLDIRFVASYLLSREGLAQLQRASPGSADRNRTLSMDSFSTIQIPLPPKEQQLRIVSHLRHIEAVGTLSARAKVFSLALLPAARNEEFARLT